MSDKTNRDAWWRSPAISRRGFLKGGLIAGGALLAGGPILNSILSAAQASAPATGAAKPRAKSVIQIWMWGGPSQLDTFDPKPAAGKDYTGPFDTPIATNVPGITIGQMLPLLAKQADKYAIIRSMTHGVNSHETASYLVQTGHTPGGRIVYPGVGAVVSYFKGARAGYQGLIPPYVVLTEPQGRFPEEGFLDSRYKPFATGGDPAKTPFAVEGVVAEGVSDDRQRARRKLLEELSGRGRASQDDPQVKAMESSRDKAYDLITGNAGKVFDLSQEKDDLREQYGKTTFGQSCLVARRLVEAGVPYVTVNYKGWDTHKQHFQEMRRKLPEMDKGFATLLQDLADRKLLDSTIVWWTGEFGRTPRVQWEAPWNGGRGHWGDAFSAVVAGGGFKGGKVVGATDAKGEHVKERPVHPSDLIASIYELLGIDLDAKLPHPLGLDVKVMEAEGSAKIAPLKEIM